MNEHEIARRASALPDRFATRIDEQTLEGLHLMDEGGEYGELISWLVPALAGNGAVVSAAEQRELRALLEAMDMPTDPLQHLTVSRSE